MSETRLTCGGCGGHMYNILFNFEGDIRAECADCGRPTRALDTPVRRPVAKPSNDRYRALKGQPCAYCDEPLDEDIMIPEGAGPMHSACWVEWMGEQG